MIKTRTIWLVLAMLWLIGCVPAVEQTIEPTPVVLQPTTTVPARTVTVTVAPSLTPTLTPTITPTATITPTPQPPGCQQPVDDLSPVQVNGWTINRRTMAMLEHAQALYGGELEISGYHITQGSYHDNGAASFGTHLGGGAVDLSVMRRDTYTVLWDDVEPLIRALRAAGFAAWLREYGELFADSPIHIHAIAIGDPELSQAARDQLDGPFGYFRGYTGVPTANGIPLPDRHGGPVLCQWMLDLGYRDLRAAE